MMLSNLGWFDVGVLDGPLQGAGDGLWDSGDVVTMGLVSVLIGGVFHVVDMAIVTLVFVGSCHGFGGVVLVQGVELAGLGHLATITTLIAGRRKTLLAKLDKESFLHRNGSTETKYQFQVVNRSQNVLSNMLYML